MLDAAQLADQVARLARDSGWTLVEHRAAGDRVALMFEVNTSPYGAESSRERAKARVAVATDIFSQRVVEETERLMEEGRRHLASARENLIAAGVDPAELETPLAPDTGSAPSSHEG